MAPTGLELLERCLAQDANILALAGITGLPNDSELLNELPYVVSAALAPAISRAASALQATQLPAGVLTFPGQPRLFVSRSRLGAVWLLRELIPDAVKLFERDGWGKLAALAWAADVAGRARDEAEKQAEAGEDGEGEKEDREDIEEEEEEESGDGEEDGGRKSLGPPLDTQERMEKDGLNTQEQQEYAEDMARQRGIRLSGKVAQLGTVQTIGNAMGAAERRRKRKRDAEAAYDSRQ